MKLNPIHPFPARMAPNIVFEELINLEPGRTVLDPMSGSGTVLRGAAELGHTAIGFDRDPLAVLMSRVWTTPLDTQAFLKAAQLLVEEARTLESVSLPWLDECEETKAYVDFWFQPDQITPLRRIAFLLSGLSGSIADAMRLSLSRIIITKGRGASVARDTSHSRPHRVYFENDFDVFGGFLASTKRLAIKLAPEKLKGPSTISLGDSRDLSNLEERTIDIVITSPPYLNAIDYLRGHRLSLVWLGHGVTQVRAVRSDSIGAESCVEGKYAAETIEKLIRMAGNLTPLPQRYLGMIERYAQDVYSFMQEIERVTKGGGRVLVVVGNSCLRNVPISNADICVESAKLANLQLVSRNEREIPSGNRYLPTPETGSLGQRMRTETLLSFCCQA